MNAPSTCCLCSQIAGEAKNDMLHKLVGNGQNYVRRVPIENNGFVVIPSIGPLTPGHVLLCPKVHVKSLACLSDQESTGLVDLKMTVIRKLKDRFAPSVHCFEHGSAPSSDRIVCTVDHAHLHLVPAAVDVDVWPSLAEQLAWEEISPNVAALRAAVGTKEYLYYETPDARAYVSVAGQNEFKSQFLRQVFAEALGHSDQWNWRDFPAPSVVRQSLETLAAT